MNVSQTAYFYLTDHLGSTRSVISESGELVVAYLYYSYGEMIPINEDPLEWEMRIRETFTGKEFDQDGADENGVGGIQCYYFGARYYDADVGIWLSTDAASQFYNAYGYTTNPIIMVDPDGNYVVGAIVGAVVGGYMGGVMSSGSFNPADWEAQDWLGAGMGAISGAMTGSAIENTILHNYWMGGGQFLNGSNYCLGVKHSIARGFHFLPAKTDGGSLGEYAAVFNPDNVEVDPKTMQTLKTLDENTPGVDYTITTGVRTPAENARVGGSKGSHHLKSVSGTAIDVNPSFVDKRGYTEAIIAQTAKESGFMGVIHYPSSTGMSNNINGGRFHFDLRQNAWYSQAYKNAAGLTKYKTLTNFMVVH